MRPVLLLLLLTLPLVACQRPSVLVVALDGATWSVMDPLMDAGHLPAMRDVVEGGVKGEYDCEPALPPVACFCPPVWASLATGHTFERHGILQNFQDPAERGVKAVWSVLRDYGGTTTAVQMRTTWPPDPDIDVVLTMPGLAFAAHERHDRWPAGLPLPAFVEELRTKPLGLLEELDILPYDGPRPPVWAAIAHDRVAMEGLSRLLERQRTDLTLILLHSPDKVEHVLWSTVQPTPQSPVNEATLLALAERYEGPTELPGPWGWGTIAAPYLEIDDWLGELLAEHAFDYVVFVSDHGMTRRDGPGLAGDHGPGSPSAHQGILAIRGPGVRVGAEIGLSDIRDFAPTLAYLLELPVGADLPGRVLEEAFEPEHLERVPVGFVPTWETSVFAVLLEVFGLGGDQGTNGADAVAVEDPQGG